MAQIGRYRAGLATGDVGHSSPIACISRANAKVELPLAYRLGSRCRTAAKPGFVGIARNEYLCGIGLFNGVLEVQCAQGVVVQNQYPHAAEWLSGYFGGTPWWFHSGPTVPA